MKQVILGCLLLFAGPLQAQKILTVCNDITDPVSLDPHREFDANSDNIVNHIFDGLVGLTVDGNVEPALAESWKRIDDFTVEFKLRKNVLFHNGEPFDAEAVRFSLERQLNPQNPAPNAAMVGTIDKVEVIDSHKIRIKSKEKDGVLLNKLPMFVKILPPSYLKQSGDQRFAAHPIGTGPFIFERWIKGDRIELKANKSYWRKGLPKVDGLIFKFLPLPKQLEALLDGKVDMVTDLSGLDTLKVAQNPKTKIVKAQNFYAVALMFNTRKKPFSDLNARLAVAHALDPAAIVRYGAKGNGVVLNSFTMPGEFGHNPKIKKRPYDLKKVSEFLAQAGYKQGLDIKIQIREEIGSFGKVIAANLRKAGIRSEPYYVSQEKQFKEIVLPNIDPNLPPWDGDIYVAHWVDPMAHVYFPYSILVYSKGPYSLARDADFDKSFLEMASTVDAADQEKLAWQLEEQVHQKCLVISAIQVLRPFGMAKNVFYEPHITGMLDLRGVSVEE